MFASLFEIIKIEFLNSRLFAKSTCAEEMEEDEVSNTAIENVCKKLREIKGVEQRKRNENVRRRHVSEFNTFANSIGLEIGGFTDGGEQGSTDGQTLAQALQVTELLEGKSREIYAIEIDESFFQLTGVAWIPCWK